MHSYKFRINDYLHCSAPSCWKDISDILLSIRKPPSSGNFLSGDAFRKLIRRGIAFLTFDYGIDGVSIEIAKYAASIEGLFPEEEKPEIHFLGSEYYPQADSVLESRWNRFTLPGTNGWSKWDDGKWFSALFYEDMPENSRISSMISSEIYKQAISIADRLGNYLSENGISLLIPVNIASNPGNPALTLAVVMVTEALGIYVLNSNHDFYWEGGKPESEKLPGEEPGIRDHFFRNSDNRRFFSLFESLYPWNGQRWIQVNINTLQSHRLINQYGFSKSRVFEISTCLSDEFFRNYTREDVIHSRLRMSLILSDGKDRVSSVSVESHLDKLEDWMANQVPCVIGFRNGLTFDALSENLTYLLQPTRIIARKRIEKNIHLLFALLKHKKFLDEFFSRHNSRIVLHITGPTPIEHQNDLETILRTYSEMKDSISDSILEKVFLAFSVGKEYHDSFRKRNLEKMCIEDIYRMATAVLFPSETEGRGLPILEAGASGIPLITSRYNPVEVFDDVVGKNQPEEQRVSYTLFPEGDFPETFLDEVTDIFLHRKKYRKPGEHNRKAVLKRYGTRAFEYRFDRLLEMLRKTSEC